MDTLHLQPDTAVRLDSPPGALPEAGFLWIDLTHEEFAADPEATRDLVQRLAGVRLFDLHLQDAGNLQHPSYFDTTSSYDMLIFRKLATGQRPPLAPLTIAEPPLATAAFGRRKGRRARAERHRLQEIVTRPVTFFVFDRLLVTVRNTGSRTIELVRSRLLDFRARALQKAISGPGAATNGETPMTRLPQHPEELLLRLVNGMVDRYLDLRQPLTDTLDGMQRELLDPRRSFSDWTALLDARIELRRMENLCEEQLDALQELRDAYVESTPEPQQSDAHLVRIADVIEHIHRVLNHSRRLEGSVETAVQLHFSATSHRTNRIVRGLTVITVVFGVLTLLAGIWGMNFKDIPLADHPHGFAIMVGIMVALAATLLSVFWVNRYLSDRP
jgi:Mg2+ and Co2+ transporter CorA